MNRTELAALADKIKSPTDFLVDMLEYYTSDPKGRRSVNPKHSQCMYRLKNPNEPEYRRCAIGRWIADEDYNAQKWGKTESDVPFYKALNQIPDHIQKFGLSFLRDVQDLHDKAENWIDIPPGLSDLGRRVVWNICSEYNLDPERLTSYLPPRLPLP